VPSGCPIINPPGSWDRLMASRSVKKLTDKPKAKPWRVRCREYPNAAKQTTRFFKLKSEADDFFAKVISDLNTRTYVNEGDGRITFRECAEGVAQGSGPRPWHGGVSGARPASPCVPGAWTSPHECDLHPPNRRPDQPAEEEPSHRQRQQTSLGGNNYRNPRKGVASVQRRGRTASSLPLYASG
jgi:hypothetical protein